MYTLLVTGDVPGAATYFNPLLQQTVIPCTSGTRPSSPGEGWLIYETDTDRYMSYNSAAWRYLGQNLVNSFTPVLTAASVNPVLGTGGVAQGKYILHNGNTCTYWGYLQFGTSSFGAGSGQYYVSLPVNSSAGVSITCGSAILRDLSAAAVQSATSFAGTSVGTLSFLYNGNVTTNVVPWTWSASDYLAFNITYEF